MVLKRNIIVTQFCSALIMLTGLFRLCTTADFDFDKFLLAHHDDKVLTTDMDATDAQVQHHTIQSKHDHVVPSCVFL